MMSMVVHTTGVNWQSVGTIIGCIVAALGLVSGWINSTIERHRKDTSARVEEMSRAIGGRLDKFDGHLDEQDRSLQAVGERVSRLEGPVQRTAATAAKLAADNAG